jgi:hypothetical protein
MVQMRWREERTSFSEEKAAKRLLSPLGYRGPTGNAPE